MSRDVLRLVMEAELEEKLGYEKSQRVSEFAESGTQKNYRNGYSKKTVKTQLGKDYVKIPRNRNGEYEPQIIGKYNRNADGMEEKILALYACGISQRDISEQSKCCILRLRTLSNAGLFHVETGIWFPTSFV